MELMNKLPEGVKARVVNIRACWLPVWKLWKIAFFDLKENSLFEEEYLVKLVKISEEWKVEKIQVVHKNFFESIKKRILGDDYIEPLSKKELKELKKQEKLKLAWEQDE